MTGLPVSLVSEMEARSILHLWKTLRSREQVNIARVSLLVYILLSCRALHLPFYTDQGVKQATGEGLSFNRDLAGGVYFLLFD